METFLVILELFGGVILVLVIGYLLGRLLKLDKYINNKDKD
jgi:NhaP-type Na+/H+ or K+/H+ antiporter